MARTTSSAKPALAKAAAPAKAGAAPRAQEPGGPRRHQSSGSVVVTLGVIVVTVMAVAALPLCLLVVAGMLPSLAAAAVDRTPRRYFARTVGAMNLAGLAPGVLRLWEAGMTFASLRQVASSPWTWLAVYGAAGLGWLLFSSAPTVARVLLDVKVDETQRRLEARAKALVEEWGDEVTGRKPAGGA
jgi:hypothetical protein